MGETLRPRGESRCMTYSEFLERWSEPNFRKSFEPLTTFIEGNRAKPGTSLETTRAHDGVFGRTGEGLQKAPRPGAYKGRSIIGAARPYIERNHAPRNCSWRLSSTLDPYPVQLLCRFSDAGMTDYPRGVTAGVRKAPRHEIAGRGTDWAVPRAQLWGFGPRAGHS